MTFFKARKAQKLRDGGTVRDGERSGTLNGLQNRGHGTFTFTLQYQKNHCIRLDLNRVLDADFETAYAFSISQSNDKSIYIWKWTEERCLGNNLF